MFSNLVLCQSKLEEAQMVKEGFMQASHPLNGSINILVGQNDKLKSEKQLLKKQLKDIEMQKCKNGNLTYFYKTTI